MCLFCWTQRKIFWRMWETEQFWGTIDFHSIFFPTMEVNGAPKQPDYKLSSKYLPLCSAEQRNSYRFGTTWGWVNDDRIYIFGWTIPLTAVAEASWLMLSSTLLFAESPDLRRPVRGVHTPELNLRSLNYRGCKSEICILGIEKCRPTSPDYLPILHST